MRPIGFVRKSRAQRQEYLRPFAHGVEDTLKMPLDIYAAYGGPIEVAVPWWTHTLWFVPDERHAALLASEGVSRGRIWTTGELMDLLPLRDAPEVQQVALAKLEFAGEIVEVRPRA